VTADIRRFKGNEPKNGDLVKAMYKQIQVDMTASTRVLVRPCNLEIDTPTEALRKGNGDD